MSKKIGVIGLGSIGLRHAKNLANLGHQVIAWDPDRAKCDEAMRYRGSGSNSIPIGTVDCIHDATHGDEDGVVIASPTNLHIEHLSRVLREHTAPVFVEKPIAHSDRVFHLEDLIKSRPMMVGYNLRFHSCVKKAKEWLDAGLIGEPIWANFTCAQYNDKPAYLRDGVIFNWSHEIDLALYLLGPAKVAASSTRIDRPGTANSDVNCYGVGDSMADILLTHDSGTRSAIHLDYDSNPEHRGFTIVGTRTSMTANLLTGVMTVKRNYGDELPDLTICLDNNWSDNYIEEMQAFLDRIDGKQTLGADGKDGLAVLDICLEVRKAAGLT